MTTKPTPVYPLAAPTYTRHLDNRVEAGEITAEEAAEAWKEHHADDRD